MEAKIKIIRIGIIMWFQTIFLYSQAYQDIDKQAFNLKYQYSIAEISNAISAFASTDEEKVRAVFVWIANNISYDTDAFFSGNYPENTVEATLKNKKAVCEGYCMLFKKYCDLNKIPCVIMNGYSKGVGYRKGKSFTNTDHTWNIVKIGGEWKLIEPTWASGYVNGREFTKQFFPQYFFSNPEQFILNHLPADPMWQLLSCKIPVDIFEKDSIAIKNYMVSQSCKAAQNKDIAIYYALDSINRFRVFNENAYAYNPKNQDGLVQLSFIYSKYAYDNILILNSKKYDGDKTKTIQLATDANQHLIKSAAYIKKVTSKEEYFQNAIKMQNQIIPQNREYVDWVLKKGK